MAPPRKATIADRQLDQIIARLKIGKTSLIEESRALGYDHNNALRPLLRNKLGSDYEALILQNMTARRTTPAEIASK